MQNASLAVHVVRNGAASLALSFDVASLSTWLVSPMALFFFVYLLYMLSIAIVHAISNNVERSRDKG